MNSWARVCSGVFGRRRKNLRVFCIIILAGLTLGTGMYLEKINMAYQAYFGEKYGSTILIEDKAKKGIPEEVIHDISQLKNVIGCDAEQMETVIYEKEEIPLSLHTGLQTVIKAEKYSILSGDMVENNAADEIMIGKSMADRYQLTAGDTLHVQYNNKSFQLHISGILDTNRADHILYGTDETGKMLGTATEVPHSYTIYVDTWKNLKKTEKSLKNKMHLEDKYSWVDSVDNAIVGFSGIAGLFARVIPMLYAFASGAVLSIYFLVIVLWVKAYDTDMGTYIALGLPEHMVAKEMVLRITCMNIAAVLPIAAILKICAKSMVRAVLMNVKGMSLADAVSPMQDIDTMILNTKVSAGMLSVKAGIWIWLLSCICVYCISRVMCMKGTRKLFRDKI